MTDLAATIDREVGNDTEQTRVTYLKYVNYGRRLGLEELAATEPKYTQAQYDEAVARAAQQSAHDVLREVKTIMDSAAQIQNAIEEQEDARMAEFAKMKADGPIKADLVTQFEGLVNGIDAQHSAVVHSRDLELKALRDKYPAPPVEAPKA
jgi:hypothetical protein